MNYRYVTVDDLVVLTLRGEVDLTSWESCFIEQEQLFAQRRYKRLLIDGSGLTDFAMSSAECMQVARGFGSYASKAAMYAEDNLVFGMLRIVHSCAFNDDFQVFKTRAQALEFLSAPNGQPYPA